MPPEPCLPLSDNEKNIPPAALQGLADLVIEARATAIPIKPIEARAAFWNSLSTWAARNYMETVESLNGESSARSA
jgi:hypothetical protein